MIPNFGRMLDTKIGITVDRVETNEHAILTPFSALDEKELSMFQRGSMKFTKRSSLKLLMEEMA